MKHQKPLTQDLEELVEQLALVIQDYPEVDKEIILSIARDLEEELVYGQKQQCKDNLLQRLGYDTKGHKIGGSLQTISQIILYLSDLKVKDIGKIITRFPAVLSYDVTKTMQPRVEYLRSIGVKEEDIGKVVTRLPAVLGLDIRNLMERRLQTLVYRKNLSRSVKQARQFIVHGQIIVKEKKISSPSYIVKLDEEGSIGFA